MLVQRISDILSRKVTCFLTARFDEELRDAIDEESEDKIIKAAIGCGRGSERKVIDAIIEEIKVNREKIIKEGKVSDEVIEAGIRSFLNQGTSLSDVNVSQGANVGMSRASFN